MLVVRGWGGEGEVNPTGAVVLIPPSKLQHPHLSYFDARVKNDKDTFNQSFREEDFVHSSAKYHLVRFLCEMQTCYL